MNRDDDEIKKKYTHLLNDEGDDSQSGQGETGTGGSTGETGYHYQDIISNSLRDDLLSEKELKRILALHGDLHKARVDNQKQLRKDRKQLKEGQASLTARQDYSNRARMSGGGGRSSQYKSHPISNKAQFSGSTDQKVNALPTQNNAETNEKDRQELTEKNEYQNRLRYTNSNRYTPKPRPY